ncbi:MAG: hypothetical protein ACI4IQ_05885 [Eubacterium sp.]
MTNTGDFRRYSYSTDAAYALKAFDVSRSSAAPAYSPNRKKDFQVRENNNKKSKAQLLKEQKIGFAKIVKIMTASALSIAMLFGVLYTYVQKNELTHEISSLETELAIAQSENTRINSELDALVSMSMIDQYAVEQLGMTKMRSNQIRYIDVSQYKEKRLAAAQMLIEKNNEQQENKTVSSDK